MRLLLIAYEFPPSPSPQSLRWAYLAGELARRGHDVHVLTIDLGGNNDGLPALPAGVEVHATYPGYLRGVVAAHRKRHMTNSDVSREVIADTPSSGESTERFTPPRRMQILRAKIWNLLQRIAERFIFPDLRGEWLPTGRKALSHLMNELHPDVIVSSHEPSTTLELGLEAATVSSIPWVADMADPVAAPYTPRRWIKKALQLEQQTLATAAHAMVTTPHARELLQNRHAQCCPISIVTQGFDARCAPANQNTDHEDAATLNLLYTGSFYGFRQAHFLLDAVVSTPGMRLVIASIQYPDYVLAAACLHPKQIHLAGFLTHHAALAAQRRADVLVNIANADASQLPGKFYEYLGAGRPILHLAAHAESDDAAAQAIRRLQRGMVADGTSATSITEALQFLSALKRENGSLQSAFQLDRESVQAHSWTALAERVETILLQAIDSRKKD